MRLGLMSTADINAALLGAVPDGVEIAAVASRDGARAQAYASEHGIERAHGSYEELLADDELDAVYISLPNGMHHEWTLNAIEAGKHVLVEKPYSRRAAEAEEGWRRRGAGGRRRDGGVHVAPPPAGGRSAHPRRDRRDRPAARAPDDVQLPAVRPRERPDGRPSSTAAR